MGSPKVYSAEVLLKLQRINSYSRLLQLSPLTIEDNALYANVMTEPDCMRYVGKTLSKARAQQSFAAAIRLNQQQSVTRLYLRVALVSNCQSIGIASINDLNTKTKTADIGRILLPNWQGRGLGSELSSMLINGLAAEFEILTFTKSICKGNIAAIKSAQKLGFFAANILAENTEKTSRYLLTIA